MNPSAPEGLWDPPQPPFDHAPPSPLLPQPPTAPPTTTSSTSTPPGPPRRARVTSAPPAKRITFFRSGDNQFGGFRMAIHRRRFKCFDALLDDLSQKVPLPFGVRTVTTPRGTRSIKHLEQLQDGGCYLCSDHRQAKPVDLELAGKRPVVWQYQGRRPRAPSTGQPHPPPGAHGAHGAAAVLLRQRRRILLVKNSEPGLRRSVVLGRRNGRSLRAFLDEVSHVMQFHVHRLYTVDGRKIDSVQSLITCPGVLVCAGSREAFSAVLLDCNRKNSEEKLPGLPCETTRAARSPPATQALSRSPPSGGGGAQCSPPRVARSRASDGSEGSKKSVNFGLETKKSVIHRRSDSSARSTRFSVSSDADKGCPLHHHHQARTVFGNDDIEKRVLVNKDGSLSVEMKVRFRLHNQETVQWSTLITKSPPASLLSSDCCPLKEDQPCYQSESCGSDPDSALSASCDHAVADYIAQSLPGRPLEEENRCPCCCQRHHEQYDLWENPVHSHTHPVCAQRLHTSSRHSHTSSSSSSSCHSRRVVRRRATRHSDSGSERGRVVREEEVCVMEEVQREVVEQSGDSCVEVCRIEHCSSRSEVEVGGDGGRSVENIGTSDEEERPPSAISNSSRVLQALQEDDDDREEDNPSAGASPCCPGREPSLFPATPRPPSKRSVGSACSADRGGTPRRGEGGCQGNGAADQMDRAVSSRSEASRTSRRSTTVRTLDGEDEGGEAADDEAERRVQSSSSTRAGSNRSRLSSACTHCGGCQRGSSTPASCNSHAGEESCSRASRRSHRSHGATTADPAASPNGEADCVVGVSGASDDSDGSATSIQSNRSNLTHQECFSALSNMSRASDRSKHSPAPPLGGEPPAESTGPEEEEERAPSATSAASRRSRTSHRSDCGQAAAAPDAEASGRGTTEGEQEGENVVERAASTVSAKSNASARSAESRKSNGDARASAQTPAAKTADVEEADTNDTKDEVRASSVLSTKSAKSDNSAASKMSGVSRVSKVSGVSRKSGCSHCGKAASPCPNGADNAKCEEGRDEEQEREEEEEMDGRAASALSAKSNLSGKSSKSNKPRSHSPMSEAADDAAVRAASAMSAKSTKSNVSAGSAKSRMSDNNGSSKQKEEVGEEVDDASLNSETGGEKGEGEEMEVGDKTEGGDEHEERAASATSVKSARSNLSAKSSKSHKSICKHTDIPTIETNGAEGGADEVHESDERAASAMSAKSKLSVTSCGSRKCDSNGGKREGGEEKLEARSVSAMSAKSTKSNVSAAKSHRSGRGVSPAEVPVIETTDADDDKAKAVEERTPSSVSTKTPTGGDGGSARSKSALSAASVTARGPSPSKTPTPRSPSRRAPSTAKGAAPYPSITPQTPKRRQLLPGSEAGVRGSSALSVRSAASTRSNGSKCHCDKKEEEDEELENGKEMATERAASVLSASLGVERPLSGASMGSVSLGLPEDREHESMNSDISFHTRCNLSAMSSKVKPVDIPTIETTGGNEEANEGEMPTVERSASALSAKSNASAKSSRSQKSSSNVASPKLIRGTKGQDVPAKTGHGKSTIYLNTPDNRTPSAMSSSSSNKVRIKSPTRASPKPTTPVPAGDSATIKPLRPSEGKGEDASSSIPRSPNRLRPQSAASSSRSDNKKSPPKESSQPKSAVAADDFKSPVEETWNSLSKSLSAADLLRETIAAGRPLSRGSKASERSGGASRASERRTEAAAADLTPACLPNASLNEVVSDWLKNIPTCMFAPGDELSDGGGHERGKETDDGGRGGEEVEKEVEEVEKVEEEEAEEEEEEEEAAGDAVEEEKSDAALMPNESTLSKSLSAADLLRETMAADITPSHPAALFQGSNSSIAVMKVLLSPVTGRCRSLPEVSPVYGRRLSTSAQGLLSCLAQLHLIEPGSVSDSLSHAEPRDRNQRYSEIITLLQSLWLSKPKDKEAGQHGQVSPPRSSSGVGMSSGSGGSGNNGIDGGDGKAADNEAVLSTPVADTPGQGETEAGDAGEDKPTVDDGTQGGEEESTHGAPELPAEPDGKEPSIPVEETTVEGPGVDSPTAAAAVVPEAPPPPPHQDPDPMWVLRLLKKLEKQFMNHYTDAMAEFKVRWALDDNLMLDAMIKELREEVSQRIQGSIGRELKKIQGRAGRAPRPPAGAQLSRESTMTDRRRRMLKVMKNQSVMTPDSLSDDDTAGEYSDQRSDDDYCPCDACVRKKMEARPPKMHPAATAAPVMMAFDLRKILQQKKAPETTPPPPPAASAAPVMAAFDLRKILQVKKPPEAPPPSPPASPEPADGSRDVQEEGNILEVVQEEEEEEEEGETQRQEEEEEEGKETGEEVEEEEEEGGERAEEECECRHPHETEGEGGEEEGEADEESSGGEKTEGETETDEGKAAGEGTETEGETENDGGKTAETEGEEDDSNKVTEATRDGGETSENDDGEQEKKEEEEEEEATGEEKSEDAVENEEESTPVEESTEGNTGASAEDDDEEDGEKGITEEDESGGETASTQRKGGVPLVCVTEGEDSDVSSMRPSEAGDGAAEDEGENEEDVVEEKQVNGLSHQYTRTSVESQPGSMEAIDAEPSRMASPLRPVKSQETGPKMVAGVSRGEGVSGKGQRRSRSPARVRRRKPNASDIELDDMDI